MTTRFRGITVREGALIEGDAGWGEWSPFVEYPPEAAEPWLRCAEEAAAGDWPEPVRERVPVNAIVPVVAPEDAHALVLRSGCATAKVKVADPGSPLADDLARVEAVRDALGPTGRIRVDANGAWSVDEAVTAIAQLDRAAAGLEYVEQPCAAVEDLAAVRRRVDVPIAADESIRRAEDPYRVRDLEAADVAVLKVQPLGGVRACLRIAHDIGMPVVVSSALETSLGLAAGVALAAALPDLDHACGLATRSLLTADVASPELVPVNGELSVGVPTMVPALLAGVAASPDRPAWWAERLAAVRVLREAGRLCTTRPLSRVPFSGISWSRAAARSCSPRDRATLRWRSRRTTRRRPGWSGFTPGSTSVRPVSSRWA
jgi:O-succinylbenzoate synthase